MTQEQTPPDQSQESNPKIVNVYPIDPERYDHDQLARPSTRAERAVLRLAEVFNNPMTIDAAENISRRQRGEGPDRLFSRSSD